MVIADNQQIFIIAEAGVNHNGSLETALRMVEVAATTGADAIKFQTFKAEQLVSAKTQKAAYQSLHTSPRESQLDMLRGLQLDHAAHKFLSAHCQKCGILFLSSPFDEQSVDELLQLGMPLFKIPSGEITNLPLLQKIGETGLEVVLSTGMSTLEEVKDAINILLQSGTAKKNITALQCNTEYPTPFEDVNLLAMQTLHKKLDVRVGYSDHTEGVEACIAAAALGARVLEKHFTLDRSMPGPDHAASLEPSFLMQMITAVRNIEKAIGTGEKKPSPSEIKNLHVARKYIVAARPISKGEHFSTENITAKRIGTIGISPMQWNELLGVEAPRAFVKDEPISLKE